MIVNGMQGRMWYVFRYYLSMKYTTTFQQAIMTELPLDISHYTDKNKYNILEVGSVFIFK
jgi:hypothetical protein